MTEQEFENLKPGDELIDWKGKKKYYCGIYSKMVSYWDNFLEDRKDETYSGINFIIKESFLRLFNKPVKIIEE